MIRDDEIKRLIHYAKAMGIRVTFYQKSGEGDDAKWALDGTEIVVFNVKRKTKTQIILDLIHELGHNLWWIHEKNRQPDLKFDEAISRENIYAEDPESPTPKHLRKKIWDVEAAGTKWWDSVYKDVNLKIPRWKVEASKEFDIWMYEMYYENGHFPKGKQGKEKYMEIQRKWRK